MKKHGPKAGSVVAAVITLSMATWSLTSCSGGGLNTEEQNLADAIAQDIKITADGMFDDQQSQCFGDGMVKEFGVERLAELGVTVDQPGGVDSGGPTGMNADEASRVTDVLGDCVGLKEFLGNFLSFGYGDEQATCIADQLNDDQVRSIVTAMQSDDEGASDAQNLIEEAAAKCDAG